MERQIGPYRVVGELGAGGMGVTYRARSEVHGRDVALKVLHPGIAGPQECARLVREAELLARIDHPFVVGFLDSGEHHGVPFLVMELVEGEDLDRRRRRGGALEPEEAARLVAQIAEGVEELHRRGIVHRDLKPHNVLLDARGSPRVCDLGIARGDALSRLTETGALLGTPAYLAPEQALGEVAGPPADVYALGALLFELIADRPPFSGPALGVLQAHVHTPAPELGSVRPGVPAGIAAVVARCLEKRPGERYASAGALAEALGEACAEVGAAPRRRARGRVGGALLAVGLGAVAAGLAVRAATRDSVDLTPAQVQAREACAEGDAALDREHLHAAYAAYEAALALDPTFAQAEVGLARTAQLQDRQQLAVEHAARAKELDPSSRSAWLTLASLRQTVGDDAGADFALERARALDPDAPEVGLCAAVLARSKGDLPGALRRAEAVLAREDLAPPLRAEGQVLRANLLAGQGDTQAALDLLRGAYAQRPDLGLAEHAIQLQVAFDPDGPWRAELEAYRAAFPGAVNLERLYATAALPPAEAVQHLEALRAREPESLGLRVDLARVRAVSGRDLDLAQRDLDAVLRESPGLVDAWRWRIRVAAARFDVPGARDAARSWATLPRPPSRTPLQVWWTWANRAADPQGAQQAAEGLWALAPSRGSASSFAHAALRVKDLAGARSWIARGRELAPGDPEFEFLERVLELQEAPSKEAVAAATAAIPPTRQDNSVVVLNLARARYTWRELSEQAALAWERELQQGGELDTSGSAVGGWVALRLAHFARARQCFEEAFLHHPGDSEALAGLAELYGRQRGGYEAGGCAALALERAAVEGIPAPPQCAGQAQGAGAEDARRAWSQPLDALRREVRDAHDAGDLPRLHVKVLALLSRAPEDVRGWVFLARLRTRRGRTVEAQIALGRANVLGPEDLEVLELLGRLALKAGDAPGLARCRARLQAQAPDSLEARRLAAASAIAAEEPEGWELLARLREEDPQDEDCFAVWAVSTARDASGREQVRRALEERHVPRLWLLLADAAAGSEAWGEVGEALERAAGAEGPDRVVACALRARFERARGSSHAAEAAWAEWLRLDPLSVEARLFAVDRYLAEGGAQAALDVALGALALSSPRQAPQTLHAVLDACEAAGDEAELRRAADSLVRVAPADPRGHALLLERAGDDAEARTHAEALLQCPAATPEQRAQAEARLRE
ncbi:MAG: protein kinase [Planctomycetota bacterium]